MNKFFSFSFLVLLGNFASSQSPVDFEKEVNKIDSLIELGAFEQSDSALLLLKASLENTSLIKQDSILLFFSSKLAFVNYQQGDCEKTIKYSKENITLNNQLYGEASSLTLSAYRNLGIYYLNCDSLDRSIEVLDQTITLHKKHFSSPDEIYARTLDDLAFAYGKQGEIGKAIDAYEELLNLLGDSKSSFYLDVIENYSALLMSSEKYERAGDFFEDLKSTMSKKQEYPLFLRDYYNVFVHLKDYVRALESASLLTRSCDENEDLCASVEIDPKEFVLSSARLSMLLAQYESAKNYYSRAEIAYEANPSIYIAILLEEAELYDVLREKYRQMTSLNKSIAYHRQHELVDSLTFSKSVLQLGKVYTEMGKFDQADQLFKEYIEDLESNSSGDPIHLAVAYQSLGNQRYLVQNFKDADQYLNKSRQLLISSQQTATTEYASVLNSLGALYEGIASYQKAESMYREALSSIGSATTGLKISLASNLANVLMKTSPKNDSILVLLNQAIEWQEEASGKNHPTYANMVGNRALHYQNKEKFIQAEEDYKVAQKIFEQTVGEEHPQYLSVLSNLGLLYNELKMQDEALSVMLNAKELYEKYYSSGHPGYLLTLNNLANLYTDLERYSEAEELLLNLAEVEVKEINNSFSYLSESEKKSFVKEKQKLLGNFKGYVVGRSVNEEGSISPEVLEKWYDLELNTKGILLNSTKKVREQIFNSGDEELIKLFSEWTVARKEIADIKSLKNDHSSNNQSVIDSLNQTVNRLEKELSRKSSEFSGSFASTPPSFQQIRSKLKSDEASVEIIRTQIDEMGVYTALIGTSSDPFPKIIVIGKSNELEDKTYSGYKNGIKFKIEDARSFESFWRAIHDYLYAKSITKIYYAPDGVYHKLSLATLYNPDSKNYLLEELSITQLTSTKDIISISETIQTGAPEIGSALLAGRPSYKMDGAPNVSTGETRGIQMISDVSDLPGTEEEINAIKELLSGGNVPFELLLRADATEGGIKENLNSQLVHIATHGFFLDGNSDEVDFDPMLNSGLLFAGVSDNNQEGEDGILTAYEIMNLGLSNTDMVVLSACETGLGEVSSGEGIYGLQRAFFVGGAKTVIMSLWKVDDAATKDLMTAFYKEYLKKGDKREAFVNAQKKIKKKYKAPIFWGAFVMLGG